MIDKNQPKITYNRFRNSINGIKPELGILYIILRKMGKPQVEIKEALKVHDPFSFFRNENIARAFIHLFDDFVNLDYSDWEILEKFHQITFDLLSYDRFRGMMDTLIHVVALNQSGQKRYGLNDRIAGFLLSLLKIKKNSKVYNPFAGYASFGRNLNEGIEYYGQEIDEDTWLIGQLHLILKEDNSKSFAVENSLENWKELKNDSDILITNPPYRSHAPEVMDTDFGRTSWMEEVSMYLGSKNLQKNQRSLFLLPTGILHRNNKFTKNFRKHIVEDGMLSTIVQFPSGIIPNTQIKLCAVILEPEQIRSDFRMIDLRENLSTGKNGYLRELESISEIIERNEKVDFIRYTSIEEIRENDYNLDISRYWLPESHGVNLFEVSLGTQGTRIDIDSKDRWQEEFPLVRIGDLSDDPVSFEIKRSDLSTSSDLPVGGKLIEKNVLLLSTKFGKLKPTWLDVEDQPVWISSNILAIGIDQGKIFVPYLIQELHSDKVKAQLEAYSYGQTIKSIRRADLRRIEIELPSFDIQKSKVASYQKRAFQIEEAKIKELINENLSNEADSLSFLRHSLARNIKNANDVADDLKKIFDNLKSNGISDIYNSTGKDNETLTLAKNLEILKRELESAREVLRRTSLEIDLKSKRNEKINIFQFIQNYARELKTLKRKTFKVLFDYDELIITKEIKESLYITGDPGLLKKVFDNIVENANKHGFENIPFDERILKIEVLFNEGDEFVQIDFSNTGNTLPEDYSHSSFIRKGSRSGINAGDGYGGYLIDKIMRSHGGSIGFTDETGPEGIDDIYVTSFEVQLPCELKF